MTAENYAPTAYPPHPKASPACETCGGTGIHRPWEAAPVCRCDSCGVYPDDEAAREDRPGKVYRLHPQVGKVQHLVSFHDGRKTHRDGSPFYDLRCFSNQKDAAAFVKTLEADGYRPE